MIAARIRVGSAHNHKPLLVTFVFLTKKRTLPKMLLKTFHTKTGIQRYTLLITGFLAIALSSVPILAAAGLLDEIKARGVLRVVTEDTFPPYEFITNGKPDGFHADVIAQLRIYAPFAVDQKQRPWTGLLAAVNAGTYDVAITGAGVTKDRLATFDFCPPISINDYYYIKRKGDERIKNIRDLSGLTVGIQAGSAGLASLEQLRRKLKAAGGNLGQIIEYQSYPEVYEDLAKKRLDYTVNSIINCANLVKKHPDTFELGQATSGHGFIAWPVKKGNEDLLNYLTGFIAHLRDTGTLAELQEKWFGKRFPNLPQESITSEEQLEKLLNDEKP